MKNKFLQYLKYLIRHKYYVGKFCFSKGLIWQGIVHDLSKFRPDEFIPYMDYFYGDSNTETMNAFAKYGITEAAPYGFFAKDRFNIAWLKHQHRNLHHWQYWVLKNDDGSTMALPMPLKYMKEMLCDWRGAGMAIAGKDNTKEWYLANKSKMILAASTIFYIESELGTNVT